MIQTDDILLLHYRSIDIYGGSYGLRDAGIHESAIARPFQHFDGNELYNSVIEKAAALGESLIVNHPYVDGNKRTGFLAMTALLYEEGLGLTASPEEAYDFVIAIATGNLKYEGIVAWLKEHCTSR